MSSHAEQERKLKPQVPNVAPFSQPPPGCGQSVIKVAPSSEATFFDGQRSMTGVVTRGLQRSSVYLRGSLSLKCQPPHPVGTREAALSTTENFSLFSVFPSMAVAKTVTRGARRSGELLKWLSRVSSRLLEFVIAKAHPKQ